MPWPGAVAVSGGGDSLALMLMLARAKKNPAPIVLSVDHGLRPDLAGDANAVVQAAKKLGLEAHVLRWTGAKPKSDIEAAARDARYRLMGEWCAANRVGALYLAHTLEDQAETFLLRLARGSGLDGLSAMQQIAPFPLPGFGDLKLVRPLLSLTRAQLRVCLKEAGLAWRDDPMNEDPRFARVRIRQSWPQLEGIGLTPARIAATAAHLARARAALDAATEALIAEACRFDGPKILLDGAALARVPREIGLRALATLLGRAGAKPYRPRFERLERLFEAALQGRPATLHGCRIGPVTRGNAPFGGKTLEIVPENPRKRRK